MILRKIYGLISKPLKIYIPFDSGAEKDSSIRILIANFFVVEKD